MPHDLAPIGGFNAPRHPGVEIEAIHRVLHRRIIGELVDGFTEQLLGSNGPAGLAARRERAEPSWRASSIRPIGAAERFVLQQKLQTFLL